MSGHQPVLHGGPVQTDRGFVVHQTGGHWEPTRQVSSRIQVTTSPDILAAMARGGGPERPSSRSAMPAGEPGSSKTRLAHNSWLTVPADERMLFDLPYEQRWRAAGRCSASTWRPSVPHVGHA